MTRLAGVSIKHGEFRAIDRSYRQVRRVAPKTERPDIEIRGLIARSKKKGKFTMIKLPPFTAVDTTVSSSLLRTRRGFGVAFVVLALLSTSGSAASSAISN